MLAGVRQEQMPEHVATEGAATTRRHENELRQPHLPRGGISGTSPRRWSRGQMSRWMLHRWSERTKGTQKVTGRGSEKESSKQFLVWHPTRGASARGTATTMPTSSSQTRELDGLERRGYRAPSTRESVAGHFGVGGCRRMFASERGPLAHNKKSTCSNEGWRDTLDDRALS